MKFLIILAALGLTPVSAHAEEYYFVLHASCKAADYDVAPSYAYFMAVVKHTYRADSGAGYDVAAEVRDAGHSYLQEKYHLDVICELGVIYADSIRAFFQRDLAGATQSLFEYETRCLHAKHACSCSSTDEVLNF